MHSETAELPRHDSAQRPVSVTPPPHWHRGCQTYYILLTKHPHNSTDALIFCIPLPLLWKLQIPLRKKLVIGLLLSSGLFVIIAALIRVILTLGASPSALSINGVSIFPHPPQNPHLSPSRSNIPQWGVRETLVGIVTVNIPVLRPIFNKSFWTGGLAPPGSSLRTTVGGKSTTISGPYEMAPSIGGGDKGKSFDGSQEFIIQGKGGDGADDNVVIKTTYEVRSEEARDGAAGDEDGWGARGGMTKARAYRGDEAV